MCPRLEEPFPAHSQDLMTTRPMGEPRCCSIGRPASLTAGMSPSSLCAKPLHMQLRAQDAMHQEDLQALPDKQPPKREAVTLVTPPAHRIVVPPSPAATHTNEELCHHGQGAWREATSQPACLATFRDNLWCWTQPVCNLCFGFAARLAEQELNPASLSCPRSPGAVKKSYNQLRADPLGTFHLFKSRCSLGFIYKRNRVKDAFL